MSSLRPCESAYPRRSSARGGSVRVVVSAPPGERRGVESLGMRAALVLAVSAAAGGMAVALAVLITTGVLAFDNQARPAPDQPVPDYRAAAGLDCKTRSAPPVDGKPTEYALCVLSKADYLRLLRSSVSD
jgi:hypothetical protein